MVLNATHVFASEGASRDLDLAITAAEKLLRVREPKSDDVGKERSRTQEREREIEGGIIAVISDIRHIMQFSNRPPEHLINAQMTKFFNIFENLRPMQLPATFATNQFFLDGFFEAVRELVKAAREDSSFQELLRYIFQDVYGRLESLADAHQLLTRSFSDNDNFSYIVLVNPEVWQELQNSLTRRLQRICDLSIETLLHAPLPPFTIPVESHFPPWLLSIDSVGSLSK